MGGGLPELSGGMYMIDDDRKLVCAKRELKMRERVYPRWVAEGRMKAHQAQYEIETMAAIVADYQAAVAAATPSLFADKQPS